MFHVCIHIAQAEEGRNHRVLATLDRHGREGKDPPDGDAGAEARQMVMTAPKNKSFFLLFWVLTLLLLDIIAAQMINIASYLFYRVAWKMHKSAFFIPACFSQATVSFFTEPSLHAGWYVVHVCVCMWYSACLLFFPCEPVLFTPMPRRPFFSFIFSFFFRGWLFLPPFFLCLCFHSCELNCTYGAVDAAEYVYSSLSFEVRCPGLRSTRLSFFFL